MKYKNDAYRARAGASACKGRRIARSKLDNIVLDERLLVPKRLRDPLSGWLDHSSSAAETRREKLRQLRTRETSLEGGSIASSTWWPRAISPHPIRASRASIATLPNSFRR